MGKKKNHIFTRKNQHLVSEIKLSPDHALLTEMVSTGMLFFSSTIQNLCAPRVFSSSSCYLETLMWLLALFQTTSSVSVQSLDINTLPRTQVSILLWIPQKVVRSEMFGARSFEMSEWAFSTKLSQGISQNWRRNKTLLIHVQVDQICGLPSSFPVEICPLIRIGVCLLLDSFMLLEANGMTLCISNELKQEYQKSPML